MPPKKPEPLLIGGYPLTSCTDGELISERKQIKISIECGPGPTVYERLREKQQLIDAELQRRQGLVKAAADRIANEEQQRIRKLVRRYVERKLYQLSHDSATMVAILGEVDTDDEAARGFADAELLTIIREIRTGSR